MKRTYATRVAAIAWIGVASSSSIAAAPVAAAPVDLAQTGRSAGTEGGAGAAGQKGTPAGQLSKEEDARRKQERSGSKPGARASAASAVPSTSNGQHQ